MVGIFHIWDLGVQKSTVEFSLLSLYYEVSVLLGWFAGCLSLSLTNWWNLFSGFERSLPISQLKILKFTVISVICCPYTFTWILDKFLRLRKGLYIFETVPPNDLIIWIWLNFLTLWTYQHIIILISRKSTIFTAWMYYFWINVDSLLIGVFYYVWIDSQHFTCRVKILIRQNNIIFRRRH